MVPVALVTGFLGSGKTTLLNRLLSGPRPGFARVAILVNELGDVGIDSDLLPEGSSRQIELPGGCICCQLSDDLVASIIDILDGQPDVEAMIIETTGVAEPAPITWTLASEKLRDRIRIAAVITVVDAIHHQQHRPLSGAVDQQVEYADLLVVSKLDLCPGGEMSRELEASLRERNDRAPIIAELPERAASMVWEALADPDLERPARATPSAHSDHRPMDSVSLRIDATLDFEELEEQLEPLPANYVRIKGIARLVDASSGSDEAQLAAFHRIGTRVSYERLGSRLRAPETRMVALGWDLDRDRLARCLEAAVVPCDS